MAAFSGSASTTSSSRSTGRKCRSSTAAPPRSSRRSTRSGSSAVSAPRRYLKVLKPVRVDAGQGLRRAAARRARLPARRRDRFRRPRHRPPAPRPRPDRPRPTAARSPGPAPSASCATSSSSGRPASPSAPRSRTPSPSARTASSTRKACAIPTSSSATRSSTRSAIWPSPACRSSAPTGPIAAATASTSRVLEALFADRANYAIVEGGSAPRDRLCRDRQRHRGSGLRARYPLKLRRSGPLTPRIAPPSGVVAAVEARVAAVADGPASRIERARRALAMERPSGVKADQHVDGPGARRISAVAAIRFANAQVGEIATCERDSSRCARSRCWPARLLLGGCDTLSVAQPVRQDRELQDGDRAGGARPSSSTTRASAA